MKAVHPFPARMAPEILSGKLIHLDPKPRLVWDPMCGSGTTLRLCSEQGIRSLGSDTDPLAIKMAGVATRSYAEGHLEKLTQSICDRLNGEHQRVEETPSSPCDETDAFKSYWFAEPQRSDLARLSLAIQQLANDEADRDFLHVAMSRIIITKFRGASLAWDVSHSRPHKKKSDNDFQVIPEFLDSCRQLSEICRGATLVAPAEVKCADARLYRPDGEVDLIMTSPPYLNAIDYMRGHKFSLVWMGWTIPQLRALRAEAIGTEKRIVGDLEPQLKRVAEQAVVQQSCEHRLGAIIARYIADCAAMMGNLAQSLSADGRLVIVVADSNVRGYTVQSRRLFEELACICGLKVCSADLRAIPTNKRYLPTTGDSKLSNRMKEEWILQFSPA